MDSGNGDFFISSADAEFLANSAQALGVSNSSYSTSQSDAYSTYKSAEFLAQDEHGMTYQGGFQGGWTYPTTGDPLTAATYMQISADLRAQQTAYKGRTDPGHANSQYTAQLAANSIRNTQAMIASINRQSCNSGSIQQQQQQQQYLQEQQQQQEQNFINNMRLSNIQSEQDSIRRQIRDSQNFYQKQELQNKLDGLEMEKYMIERKMGR
jgi:hypothetical protein